MRKKMMGGGMSNRKMYGKGSNGKLKMVTNKEGKI